MNKAIRRAVFARASNSCECGCGCWIDESNAELDHAEGRVRHPEAVSNCWALLKAHHEDRTANRPSASKWLNLFLAHCIRHGYAAEAERARARIQSLRAKGLS